MAKTIKSRVQYQVTELVNNLTEANNTSSEQKRDFFTVKAMYNARRLSTLISKAKVGAMAVALVFVMASCGGNATAPEASSTEAATTTQVDTTATAVATDSTAK